MHFGYSGCTSDVMAAGCSSDVLAALRMHFRFAACTLAVLDALWLCWMQFRFAGGTSDALYFRCDVLTALRMHFGSACCIFAVLA
jgi:hypothetical protein